jgi:hypothetical protein
VFAVVTSEYNSRNPASFRASKTTVALGCFSPFFRASATTSISTPKMGLMPAFLHAFAHVTWPQVPRSVIAAADPPATRKTSSTRPKARRKLNSVWSRKWIIALHHSLSTTLGARLL